MKRLFFPAALLALFAFSWTPVMSQSSSNNDDMYYSTKSNTQDNTTTPAPAKATTPTISLPILIKIARRVMAAIQTAIKIRRRVIRQWIPQTVAVITIINNYYGTHRYGRRNVRSLFRFWLRPVFLPGFWFRIL